MSKREEWEDGLGDSDVIIQDHGPTLIFDLRSEAARYWWDDNTENETQWSPTEYIVDEQFADDLIGRLFDAGLVIERSS